MNLTSKLWLLSKEVVDKVDKRKKSGKIIIQKRLFFKSTVDNFTYKEGGISYGKSFKEIVKDSWDTKDQYDFFDKEVKSLKNYKEISQYLVKNYKTSEAQVDF